jgi:hypothetical protein
MKMCLSNAYTLAYYVFKKTQPIDPTCVILMLVGRSTTLPTPSRPAFLFRLDDVNDSHHEATTDFARHLNKSNSSLNKVTITELTPR